MSSSPKFVQPVLGRDYAVKENGTIVVSRPVPIDLRAPYRQEDIPAYLSAVDHGLRMTKKESKKRVDELSNEFRSLIFDHLAKSGRSLMVGLIGHDAAGKSGNIKVGEAAIHNNNKISKTIPYGAPDEHERMYPYFKRFFDFERFPQHGQIRWLDRFWCERMLVERVRKLAPPEDLERSFGEINAMEWMLHNNGVILIKFWLDITRREQNRRFEDRAKDAPDKLSEADIAAQKVRHKTVRCANEMFHRNGTDFAPWYIMSSECKKYSRATFLENINAELKRVFGIK